MKFSKPILIISLICAAVFIGFGVYFFVMDRPPIGAITELITDVNRDDGVDDVEGNGLIVYGFLWIFAVLGALMIVIAYTYHFVCAAHILLFALLAKKAARHAKKKTFIVLTVISVIPLILSAVMHITLITTIVYAAAAIAIVALLIAGSVKR